MKTDDRLLSMVNGEWSNFYSQLTIHHSRKKLNRLGVVQECDATEVQ